MKSKEAPRVEEPPVTLPVLVRKKEIMDAFGIGPTKLNELMNDPIEPLPVQRLGHNTVRFDIREVAAWFERWKKRCSERRAESGKVRSIREKTR